MIKYSTALKAVKAVDKYLTCYDFNSRVSIKLDDYSTFKINYTFYHKLGNYYLVFTEHHGTFIYELDEVLSIRQMQY